MSLPFAIGLPMIKIYTDASQTILERTLFLPPVDKHETLLAFKKKTVRQELVDGAERMRVIGYIPILTLKWKTYDDLRNHGYTYGQSDGCMLALTDLVEVLALAPGRLRVCPGVGGSSHAGTSQALGTGDGEATTFQLQSLVDGHLVPVSPVGTVTVYGTGGSVATNPAGGLDAAPLNTEPLGGLGQASGGGSSSLPSYTISESGLVTFSEAPALGMALTWSGSYRAAAVGFQALVTKDPDYRPVSSTLGSDVIVEFTGRNILAQPVLPVF